MVGKEEKAKMGRPSIKTPELLKTICDGISEGKSARAMCREVGIDYWTMKDWLKSDEDFATQYAMAKEDSADLWADEISEIADELPDGSLEPQVFNARQRLRVDARKWIASKLKPKKYGDKLAVGGAEDLPPVMVQKIERVIVDPSH